MKLQKNMSNRKTVLVGLSGGVDSSVAALLLKKQGYNVIGCFMKNFSDTKNPLTGECSWIEERKMAQKISSVLQIPFMTLDYENQYKSKVINPMFKSYSQGRTPNPDVSCNTLIKFPALLKAARENKADYISTGHYAKITADEYGLHLNSGKDKKKDQSYFLYGLKESQLKKILFPLQDLKKEKVREIARVNKFPNWNKKGTRGICFVGKTDMKMFLKNNIKEKPGKILSPEGKEIGAHPGISYFTIGEKVGPKKGVFISDKYRDKEKERIYVAAKKGDYLIIAPKNHRLLQARKINLKRFHKINPKEKIQFSNLRIRIRHLGNLLPGKMRLNKNQCVFYLKKPTQGIAPGQVAVIYQKKRVIGGGIIS